MDDWDEDWPSTILKLWVGSCPANAFSSTSINVSCSWMLASTRQPIEEPLSSMLVTVSCKSSTPLSTAVDLIVASTASASRALLSSEKIADVPPARSIASMSLPRFQVTPIAATTMISEAIAMIFRMPRKLTSRDTIRKSRNAQLEFFKRPNRSEISKKPREA